MIAALSSEHILYRYVFEPPSLAWVLSYPSKICQIILYLHFTEIRRPGLENGHYGLMFCTLPFSLTPSYTFPYGFSFSTLAFLMLCEHTRLVFVLKLLLFMFWNIFLPGSSLAKLIILFKYHHFNEASPDHHN